MHKAIILAAMVLMTAPAHAGFLDEEPIAPANAMLCAGGDDPDTWFIDEREISYPCDLELPEGQYSAFYAWFRERMPWPWSSYPTPEEVRAMFIKLGATKTRAEIEKEERARKALSDVLKGPSLLPFPRYKDCIGSTPKPACPK
jgi:hypothetical protein